MKTLKKILIFILVIILIATTPICTFKINTYAALNANTTKPVKVGVFLFDLNDPYQASVKQSLEDIQKENPNKIEFTFFDGKGNQSIQNESIDKAVNKGFDLLILNLVNTKLDAIKNTLNNVISKNIPLIIYSEPTTPLINFITPYKRAVLIGTDLEQSGALEAQILINLWNSDKSSIDKNGDSTLQYIMLHGTADNPAAIARTKYSITALNNAGIKTEQLALKFCEWNEECAKKAIESLFLTYDGKIETIIANNDAMAIGAIKSLQKYGYNMGDKSKTIPVVGIDAIPEARDLIKKGFMTGTVIQDPDAEAEALYKIGMNLVSGKDPLSGTDYKFDSTGTVIRLPYSGPITQ